ncbi:MAG: carbohydrate ABC transporter permease [Deinococcota bacterium]
MAQVSVQQRKASRSLPTLSGALAAIVVGACSSALLVSLWSVLTLMLSPYSVSVPLGWALLVGAGLGLVLSAVRNSQMLRWLGTVLGLGTAAGWLYLSGNDPLSFGEVSTTWGSGGALVTLALTGFLIGYGLRDLNLSRPRRDTFEVIIIRLLRGFGFVFFLSIVLFPFYFMVVASLKSRAEFLQDPTNLAINFSQRLSDLFVGYREVLVRFNFGRYILNSTFVAICTVIITLVIAILGAYAVTRLRFPGRKLVSRSILLIYMFPAIVLVVPLYSVFTQLQLRDALLGLLIVYPAQTIPVALYMLCSYFQTLPKDLEEAGMIDGCTRFEVIWRITLPLSVPALASVALYVFMIAWNEFLFAFMFLDSPNIFTLSRGMVGLNSQEVPRQFLMAGAVIVTVPIMVIFFWFEKYLVGGLTAGGVKE